MRETPQLYLRETDGQYRPAKHDDVIAAASTILETKLRNGQPISSLNDIRIFLASRLAGREAEVFSVVFLDNRHCVLEYEEMFYGTLNGCAVYPREVARRALQHNAAAVFFSHNHPAGSSLPSRADEVLTNRLKEALALVDVRVLDHIVIGDGEYVSFAERGLL